MKTNKGILTYSDEIYFEDFDFMTLEHVGNGETEKIQGWQAGQLAMLPAYVLSLIHI